MYILGLYYNIVSKPNTHLLQVEHLYTTPFFLIFPTKIYVLVYKNVLNDF